jgi:hypothetical protein
MKMRTRRRDTGTSTTYRELLLNGALRLGFVTAELRNLLFVRAGTTDPTQVGRLITQPKSYAGKESNSERPRDAMSKMEDVKRCLSGITPRPHLKITRVESELL